MRWANSPRPPRPAPACPGNRGGPQGGQHAGFDADVRIVAATNRDLAAEVARGAFRRDLFFRLDMLAVQAPFQERLEDLPALHHCAEPGAHRRGPPAAMAVLERHPWPGMARELRNVLTRAFILGGPHRCESLSFIAFGPDRCTRSDDSRASPEQEQSFIEAVLNRNGQNRSATRELGIAGRPCIARCADWG